MMSSVCFDLPNWIQSLAEAYRSTPTVEARMNLVIEAARQNIVQQTGGPFAAGVFEMGSAKLIALGVNRVTTQGLSMLHAEMVALSLAQRRLGQYNLGADSKQQYELVCSTEPCAMCLGGICWSGIRRVVSGATDADARAVGFDEGPKPADWIAELAQRDIEVQSEVMREEARRILHQYRSTGGIIY